MSCRKNEMQIDVERGVLTGFKPIYLRLNNRSCIATGNETHFSLVAPLMGCGTVSSHTGEDVVYSNQVEEEEVEIEGVISRMPELAIPFSCYYTKEGVTSTYGIIPRKVSRSNVILYTVYDLLGQTINFLTHLSCSRSVLLPHSYFHNYPKC